MTVIGDFAPCNLVKADRRVSKVLTVSIIRAQHSRGEPSSPPRRPKDQAARLISGQKPFYANSTLKFAVKLSRIKYFTQRHVVNFNLYFYNILLWYKSSDLYTEWGRTSHLTQFESKQLHVASTRMLFKPGLTKIGQLVSITPLYVTKLGNGGTDKHLVNGAPS